MYELTIQNNYYNTIKLHTGDISVKSGDSKTVNKLGNLYIEIPGLYNVNLLDLGQTPIEGYPTPENSNGVLIRSSTTELYYTYPSNSEGLLSAIVDQYGTVSFSTTNGSLLQILIDEISINN